MSAPLLCFGAAIVQFNSFLVSSILSCRDHSVLQPRPPVHDYTTGLTHDTALPPHWPLADWYMLVWASTH